MLKTDKVFSWYLRPRSKQTRFDGVNDGIIETVSSFGALRWINARSWAAFVRRPSRPGWHPTVNWILQKHCGIQIFSTFKIFKIHFLTHLGYVILYVGRYSNSLNVPKYEDKKSLSSKFWLDQFVDGKESRIFPV